VPGHRDGIQLSSIRGHALIVPCRVVARQVGVHGVYRSRSSCDDRRRENRWPQRRPLAVPQLGQRSRPRNAFGSPKCLSTCCRGLLQDWGSCGCPYSCWYLGPRPGRGRFSGRMLAVAATERQARRWRWSLRPAVLEDSPFVAPADPNEDAWAGTGDGCRGDVSGSGTVSYSSMRCRSAARLSPAAA